jgi:hypothetical protein
MKPLLAAARGKGNTLDQWAGYTPTPGEAEWLRHRAAEVAGESALLSEVGRSDVLADAGTADCAAVFDLGGNAAEWVVAAEGRGKLVGGSADRAADAKADQEASPGYRGFRVVRE